MENKERKHRNRKYEYPSKIRLEYLYIKRNMTAAEVAKKLKLPTYIIKHVAKKYGLKKKRNYYEHPPIDELIYLYLKCNHSVKEIALAYDLPLYIIRNCLYKYKIKKTIALYSKIKRQKLLKKLEKKGLDIKKLKELYRKEKIGAPKIAKKYGVSTTTIYNLLREYNIPRYNSNEILKFRKEKMQKKTFTHEKADEIKEKIKQGKIDIDELNHKKACILLSCKPGVEKIKKLCKLYGFEEQILINTYRKLEKIFYKLNLYPTLKIKIALSLYLCYKLNMQTCAGICHITRPTLTKYLRIISNQIGFHRKRREDPLSIVNIRWLFDNPLLPEIFESLPCYSDGYILYYCSINDTTCEYLSKNYKCNKVKKCQYAIPNKFRK